jgi:glycine/D-amino acid oxidase-like deaminating enzyme
VRDWVNGGRWGQPPWVIDFRPKRQKIPDQLDFAVVGGGFTGLAAAAWLRRCDPTQSVGVFEAESIGAGSSGHTGGMALGETASGDLPGLGDVLHGLQSILRELDVQCDLVLPGAWEIGRNNGLKNSAIRWKDSGDLKVVREVPGGSVDPGKMVSGLAEAAEKRGALIFKNAPVVEMSQKDAVVLQVRESQVRARCALIATNAESLELSGFAERAEPKFTLAVATEPLKPERIAELGLGGGQPFYTVDLPYLWGRVFQKNKLIFGSGLVHLKNWRELMKLDVAKGEAAELMNNLEKRVRGLHPELRDIRLSHRWGGPILIANKWQPVFQRHPRNKGVIVLGAYSGHGVALSVYLGAWAAEAMLGKRNLPEWNPEEDPAD